MQLILTTLLLTSTALSAPLDLDRPWEGISDPLIMSATFNRNYLELPLQGKYQDERKLWSGDYWALNKGNINYRWNAPVPRGFNLSSPSKHEAGQMSELELSYLSPSEKLDLLNGKYDYPLKREVADSAYPSASDWEGICHGWAPAAINHVEPTPKLATNPDGIIIPFGSSDIKALLSYYYANHHEVDTTYQMGRRCPGRRWWGWPRSCKHDLNAGAFHIVLTNRIGLTQESFVADMDSEGEVWNQPIHSYQSEVLSGNLRPNRDSAPGTERMVHIRTKLKYVMESEKNTWEPIIGTDLQLFEVEELEYLLDVNYKGEIIGGDWISAARPDFLWLMTPAVEFTGDFVKLKELLN